MKIGFIIRSNAHIWGGDIAVVKSLVSGLKALGHETYTHSSAFAIIDCDFLFLTNSTILQRAQLEELHMVKKPFGILSFHDDVLLYYTACTGMRDFVYNCLGYSSFLEASIEMLFEYPKIVYHYGESPKRSTLYNRELIQDALLWIANSPSEAACISRDHPGSKTAVVSVAPGIITEYRDQPDDSFLSFTGLSSKGYILQVGRLEVRKNQFASILACLDLEVPLVFIATQAFLPEYENACFELAARYRKAPTLFISQNLLPRQEGAACILPMPDDKKLPISMLVSAYHHAGLHLHPAFHELPGATFLEAARFGTPTVASSWCTITDYFYDPALGHSNLDGRIEYCEPWNLPKMKSLIEERFGKKYAPLTEHAAIRRTDLDAAKDLVEHLATIGLQ